MRNYGLQTICCQVHNECKWKSAPHRSQRRRDLPILWPADQSEVDRARRLTSPFFPPRRRCDGPAGALSYGSKKILGIGMALMESPKVLLMDEPSFAELEQSPSPGS